MVVDVHWIWWISWILAFFTVPSVLFQKAGRPSSAFSWILMLFMFPPLALILWWTFGRTHLKIRRERRKLSENHFEKKLLEYNLSAAKSIQADSALFNLANIHDELKNRVFQPTSGNEVTLFPDTEKTYTAWFNSIKKAKHHIHLLFYEWENDHMGLKLRDALVASALRGVKIRILVDAIGTKISMRFFEPLKKAGAKVEKFLPISLISRPATINFRNHRKLIVIDGNEAFIGGMNVGDKYQKWLDLGICLKGPGVDQVQEIFCDDWFFAVGEDLPYSDYFRAHSVYSKNSNNINSCSGCFCATIAGGPHQKFNVIKEATVMALNSAKERIWIMTPYFIPDTLLITILRIAWYNGVDIRVIVPAKNNKYFVKRASRAYYPLLLHAGVRIFEYDGMVHAKVGVIDNNLMYIGSANLDQRSFRLNFELSCFIESVKLNKNCMSIFMGVLDRCTEINPHDYEKLTWVSRVTDAFFHLFSPLL